MDNDQRVSPATLEEHSIKDVLGQTLGAVRAVEEALGQENGGGERLLKIERRLIAIDKRLGVYLSAPITTTNASMREWALRFREFTRYSLHCLDRAKPRALEAARQTG